MNDLYEAVKAEVYAILVQLGAMAGAAVGAAVGASLGTALGGPIGALLGAIAGFILGAIIGWIISWSKDEIFEPQVASLTLPSAAATFDGGALVSPTQSLSFADFGGRYKVKYSWELVP